MFAERAEPVFTRGSAAVAGERPFDSQEPDPTLGQILQQLVAALHPQRLYLFGSRARGNYRSDSDYDLLAVVNAERDQLRTLQRRGYSALWDVSVPIDVLVMTASYFDRQATVIATLVAAVLREGKLLYAA